MRTDGRASGGDISPDLAAQLWAKPLNPASLFFQDRDFGPTAEVPAIFFLSSIVKSLDSAAELIIEPT